MADFGGHESCKPSVGQSASFHMVPMAAKIYPINERTEKVDAMTKKFRAAVEQLEIYAQKLDDIHSIGKEGQARGSGVSLVGGFVGLGGVLAAPFTCGGSLLVTAASASISIGGGVKGYLSDKDMQKETTKILDDLNECITEIRNEEDQMRVMLQKFETLLGVFQEKGIQERIIRIAEHIEHIEDDGHSVDHAYAAAKPILDGCKSAAMFKSVLMSRGSTKLVRSVLTIRFLLRKTDTFIGIIPKVLISRSSETLRYCSAPMTSIEGVLRAGPVGIKTALTNDPVKVAFTTRVAKSAM